MQTAGDEESQTLTMRIIGNLEYSLYFHIPFCSRQCPYCHFFTLKDNLQQHQQLIQSFLKELKLLAPLRSKKKLISVYFGGGTPALIAPQLLEKVLLQLPITSDVEVTIEANPEEVHSSLLQELRHVGFNRLSFGAQAFQTPLLKRLGRQHTPQQIIHAVQWAHQAGFSHISLDLMYELPNQTIEDWQESLQEAAALPIDHISLYNLTIEPGTPFAKREKKLIPILPSSTERLLMYELPSAYLPSQGFEQYELSAFHRQGGYSRHNMGYWQGRPFLGIGPSAFSYWDGKRFQHAMSLEAYYQELSDSSIQYAYIEKLSPLAQTAERLAIGLRPFEGISLAELGVQVLPLPLELAIQELMAKGWVVQKQNRLQLTPEGRRYYDSVGEALVILEEA